MANEEYFPRGNPLKRTEGGKVDVPKPKRAKTSDAVEDLFGKPSVPVNKGKKKKSVVPKSKAAKQRVKTLQRSSKEGVVSIETLTSKRITDGLLLLGCVKRVNDYGLVMALPNNLTGFVSIADVSDGYKTLLQRYAESTGGADVKADNGDLPSAEPHSLEDMFSVGTVLPCKVLSSPASLGGQIKLSVNPRAVNEYLTAASLKNGTVLYGAISSEQDHGYTVDIGISGVSAFLPRNKINKAAFVVGEIVRIAVKSADLLGLVSGESRVVMVTAKDSGIAKAEKKLFSSSADSSVAFRDLVPGMCISAEIENVTDEGLYVKFASSIKACIHRGHFMGTLDSQLRGTQLRCRLLYLEPTSKAVVLTSLPHLVSSIGEPVVFPEGIKRGLILDGTVTRVYKNKAVLLQLNHADDNDRDFGDESSGPLYGYANKQHLMDGELPVGCSDFKKGTEHKCRILEFDLLEKKVMVSLKKSVLDQEFLDYANLSPGELIKCTLRAFHKQGVSVKIGRTLRGFLSFMQLTDVPLKKPQQKFKKDDELKCRILTVDIAKKRVILTAKKSLVSKSCMPLTVYSAAKSGTVFQGVIVKVLPNGCLVAFFNDVKGWVPKSQLSTEQIPYPEKVFYIGQVVKCRVISCTPNEEKLVLSFKLENLKPFGKKDLQLPSGFEIGGVTQCRVIGKTASGLDVVVGSEEVHAFLPVQHLSDNFDMASQLLQTYNVKDEIIAVYFSSAGALTVSAKPCFVAGGVQNTLPKSLEDLKPGLLCPGVVKRILDYGAFIDLGGGLTGLCPNKYLSNRRLSNANDILRVGQSVYAKVTDVDEAKRRFLVSLRMSDCYHGDTTVGLSLLKQRLAEEERIKDYWAAAKVPSSSTAENVVRSKLVSYSVGSVISVVVTAITEHGMLLTTADAAAVKAIATYENSSGSKAVVGNHISAIVVYVDFEHGNLECFVQPDIVKSVKSYCENKFSQAKPGQAIKGEALVVKDGWLLCYLRAHAVGRLAIAPTKKHLNDWDGKASYHHGQVNTLSVRETLGSLSLCTIQTDDEKKTVSLSKSSARLPKVGTHVMAEIKSIVEMQMNVTVKMDKGNRTLSGRIHVTEIFDQDPVEDLSKPLARYSVGDMVDAVIIGYREVKVKSALPISRAQEAKALVELSLRPSRVQQPVSAAGAAEQSATDPPVKSAAQHNKGDKVTVFVERVTGTCFYGKVTPSVAGVVSWWNLSSDNAVIQRFASSSSAVYPVGSGHLATVIDVRGDGTLVLSLTGQDYAVRHGTTTKAMVTGSSNQGLYVSLPHGFLGKVPLTEITGGLEHSPWDQYMAGAVIDCKVVTCEPRLSCIVSLRESGKGDSDARGWLDPRLTSKGVYSFTNITTKSLVRGYVTHASSMGVFVELGSDFVGRADLAHASSRYVISPESAFFKGMCLLARVLSVNAAEKHIDLSLLEADTGRPEPADPVFLGGARQHKPRDANASSKRRGRDTDSDNLGGMNPVNGAELSTGAPKKRKLTSDVQQHATASKGAHGTLPAAVEALPSVGFDLGTTLDTLLTPPDERGAAGDTAVSSDTARKAAQTSGAHIAAYGISHAGARKSLTEVEAEAVLYEAEQRMVSTQQMAETADDYERLVRQSPDSSMVWLSYMSHCLEGGAASGGANVEAARAVAERAIVTISYREEQERMNIWSAYLNMESMYGSSDSLQAVLARATQNMDSLKVYQRLIAIYLASAKTEAAEGVHLMLTKKFSQVKDVWLNCGLFYFRNGKAESGRELMHRCLKSLPKPLHVDVLARFAQMEFKYGSAERGRTLFETLLSTYPKRTDLWSVYIDMMVKQDTDIAQVRLILDRAVSQNFPTKTVKFFFKKYLELEEARGDEASIASVKQKALNYVASQHTAPSENSRQ